MTKMKRFQTTYHNIRIVIHHDAGVITSITDPEGQSLHGGLNGTDQQTLQERLTRHLAARTNGPKALRVEKSKNKGKGKASGKHMGGKRRVDPAANITFEDAQRQILDVLGKLPLSADLATTGQTGRYPGTHYSRLHETRNPNVRIAVHWGLLDRRACIIAETVVADLDGDWDYIENHTDLGHIPPTELETYLKYAYTRADNARSALAMRAQLELLVEAITEVSEREIRASAPGTIFKVKSITGDARHVMLLESIAVSTRQMVALYTVHAAENRSVVSSSVIRVKLSDVTEIVSGGSNLPVFNRV